MLQVIVDSNISFKGNVNCTIEGKTNLLSDSTAFGCVFSDKTGKYAIKFVKLKKTPEAALTFIKEAGIGMKVSEEHAVKIHAFTIETMKETIEKIDAFLRKNTFSYPWVAGSTSQFYTSDHIWGIYVMNHFKQEKDEKALMLREYMSEYEQRYKACPGPKHIIYKKLNASLKAFYKTGFFHGDLHFNNVVVIFDIKNGYDMNEVKHVKLFDYGISKKVTINPKSCLGSMLKKVNKAFKNDPSKNIGRFRDQTVKWQPDGAGLRSNVGMLLNELGKERMKYLLNANTAKKPKTAKKKTPKKTSVSLVRR